MTGEVFFDTYALVALLMGDPAYAAYRDLPIVCERYNLLEYAYRVHREEGGPAAARAVRAARARLLEPDRSDILAAAALKASRHGRGLSFVDAMGCTLARKHGLRF